MIERNNFNDFLSSNKLLDSLPFFRKLVNEKKIKTKQLINKAGKPYASVKLDDLAEALELPTEGAHNALQDTLTLIEVYKKAVKLSEKKDYFTLYSERYDQFSDFKKLLAYLQSPIKIINLFNQNLDLVEDIVKEDLGFENKDICHSCDVNSCGHELMPVLYLNDYNVYYSFKHNNWASKVEKA